MIIWPRIVSLAVAVAMMRIVLHRSLWGEPCQARLAKPTGSISTWVGSPGEALVIEPWTRQSSGAGENRRLRGRLLVLHHEHPCQRKRRYRHHDVADGHVKLSGKNEIDGHQHKPRTRYIRADDRCSPENRRANSNLDDADRVHERVS